ncbi:unnamed protein product [Symbiodinium sp. CCMP2592]|nr:unnamed protein product [Symbiodinium sp. CCMP2592]
MRESEVEAEEEDEEDENDEGSSRRRRKKKGGFGKKLKKGVKKAAKKVKKTAKKAAKAVNKAVKVIEEFVTELFGCIGDVFEMLTFGYEISVVEGLVAFSAGLSAGDMVGMSRLGLLEGKEPTTWMSLDVGFAVGVTAKAAWAGVGAGVGLSCSVSSCAAYLSVGTMTTVNIPTINAVCVFGAPTTPSGWMCSQVFGASISAFCCNFNVAEGKHDCR